MTTAHLYGCLPEGLQPLPAALLHVDHVLVVSLQRPLQAVHRLEHQVLALIQLLLENLQCVNLNANEETTFTSKTIKYLMSSFTQAPAYIWLLSYVSCLHQSLSGKD